MRYAVGSCRSYPYGWENQHERGESAVAEETPGTKQASAAEEERERRAFRDSRVRACVGQKSRVARTFLRDVSHFGRCGGFVVNGCVRIGSRVVRVERGVVRSVVGDGASLRKDRSQPISWEREGLGRLQDLLDGSA